MKDSARATQFRESEKRWGGMGLRVGRGESWPPCGEASGWAQVFLLELNCPVGISPEDAVNFPFLSRCAARSLWSKPASSHQPYQLVTVLPGRSSCNFGFKVSLFKPPQHKSHLWEAKARPPDRWNRDPASPSPTPPPQDWPEGEAGRMAGGQESLPGVASSGWPWYHWPRCWLCACSMTGTRRASLLRFHPRHSGGPRNGLDPQQGLWEGILGKGPLWTLLPPCFSEILPDQDSCCQWGLFSVSVPRLFLGFPVLCYSPSFWYIQVILSFSFVDETLLELIKNYISKIWIYFWCKPSNYPIMYWVKLLFHFLALLLFYLYFLDLSPSIYTLESVVYTHTHTHT